MSNKNTGQSASRRKVLKSLVVAGSATGAMNALPNNWKKPVVASVALPAHAHTSGTIDDCISGTDSGNFFWTYTLSKNSGNGGTIGGNYIGSFTNNTFTATSSFLSTNACSNGDCSGVRVWMGGTFNGAGVSQYARYCDHHQVGTGTATLAVGLGTSPTMTANAGGNLTNCPDSWNFGSACNN